MREQLVSEVIRVNTDDRETDVETRRKREKALGSVIVRFFEQREFNPDAVCKLVSLTTVFTHNKVMEALEYADELLRGKGYAMGFTLQVEEGEPRRVTISIMVDKIEKTEGFKNVIKKAIKRTA